MVESAGRVGFWTPKCMWPSQVEEPCEHDGEIVLCNETADYFVNGFSYCESHVKEFVADTVAYLEHQAATSETYDGSIYDYNFEPKTPSQLQDDIDNDLNGEWSYNGGGDQ